MRLTKRLGWPSGFRWLLAGFIFVSRGPLRIDVVFTRFNNQVRLIYSDLDSTPLTCLSCGWVITNAVLTAKFIRDLGKSRAESYHGIAAKVASA